MIGVASNIAVVRCLDFVEDLSEGAYDCRFDPIGLGRDAIVASAFLVEFLELLWCRLYCCSMRLLFGSLELLVGKISYRVV